MTRSFRRNGRAPYLAGSSRISRIRFFRRMNIPAMRDAHARGQDCKTAIASVARATEQSARVQSKERCGGGAQARNRQKIGRQGRRTRVRSLSPRRKNPICQMAGMHIQACPDQPRKTAPDQSTCCHGLRAYRPEHRSEQIAPNLIAAGTMPGSPWRCVLQAEARHWPMAHASTRPH